MVDLVRVPTFSLNTSRLSLYNTVLKAQTVTIDKKDIPITKTIFARQLDLFQNNAPFANKFKNSIEFQKDIFKRDYSLNLLNISSDGINSGSRFHNFNISINARKSMVEKINWLYFMSKPRVKKSVRGKEVFNFRMNFLTLTLPSKQVHPTAQITSECLNQFITELRDIYKMENYIWRLEFQKNGNVHYHLVTDVFLDYDKTLKGWNRIISKLGYVQSYSEKHSLMGLNDYIKAYSNIYNNDFETLKKRYLRGRSLNWKVPNTVDVKSVLGSKKISFYISKYFGKKEKTGVDRNTLDTIDNSMGLRLWFCSRSLSRLKKIVDFVPAFKIDLVSIITKAKDLFVVVHDYCTSFFYSIAMLPNEIKGDLVKLLRAYAIEQDYKPSL